MTPARPQHARTRRKAARRGPEPAATPEPATVEPQDATTPAAPAATKQKVAERPQSDPPRRMLRDVERRDRILVRPGAQLRLLVLACTDDDTTAVDLSSGALVRLRVRWPEGHGPDLAPFDVVETTLARDPQRDDLAQPEAVSAAGLPRHVGTLRGARSDAC